jgi:hypothetical protein
MSQTLRTHRSTDRSTDSPTRLGEANRTDGRTDGLTKKRPPEATSHLPSRARARDAESPSELAAAPQSWRHPQAYAQPLTACRGRCGVWTIHGTHCLTCLPPAPTNPEPEAAA